jgi:hypothetical protein
VATLDLEGVRVVRLAADQHLNPVGDVGPHPHSGVAGSSIARSSGPRTRFGDMRRFFRLQVVHTNPTVATVAHGPGASLEDLKGRDVREVAENEDQVRRGLCALLHAYCAKLLVILRAFYYLAHSACK